MGQPQPTRHQTSRPPLCLVIKLYADSGCYSVVNKVRILRAIVEEWLRYLRPLPTARCSWRSSRSIGRITAAPANNIRSSLYIFAQRARICFLETSITANAAACVNTLVTVVRAAGHRFAQGEHAADIFRQYDQFRVHGQYADGSWTLPTDLPLALFPGCTGTGIERSCM